MWQLEARERSGDSRREMLAGRFALERDILIEAGLRIMHAEGLGAVTMRAVGAAVGWGPTALYRYVEGRADLLEAMKERSLTRVVIPDATPETWHTELVGMLTQCRRALDAFPGMAGLVLARPPSGARAVTIATATLECLRQGGAGEEQAYAVAELLFLFVTATSIATTSYVAEGDPGDRFDDFQSGLGAHIDLQDCREGRFRTGLDLILGLVGPAGRES